MKFVRPNMKCPFCTDKNLIISYKNVALLLENVDYFGRLKKSYYKGNCRKHHAALSNSVKKARHMGLLKFVR